MKLVRAGRLDRRVKILRRLPDVDDGYGLQPGRLALLFARLASVKPKFGGEAIEAAGREGRTVMSFWMRHDSETRGILTSDVLELDGTRYEITAPPIEIGRREGIELLAVAGGLPE